MRSRNSQQGFTLVELVAVMIILGSISALAAPQLGNTIDSAHSGKSKHISGVLRSAVNIINAMWLAQREPAVVADGDRLIAVSSGGYPGSDAPSQANCAQAWDDVIDGQVVQQGINFGQAGWGATVAGGNCRFTYQADDDPVRRIDYNPTTGDVDYTETAAGGGGGGCSLRKPTDNSVDPVLPLLVALSLLHVLRRRLA